MTKTKMTKRELAEMAAEAMNLLMDLRCTLRHDDREFSASQENDFFDLVGRLPETLRGEFMNNATLSAKELGA